MKNEKKTIIVGMTQEQASHLVDLLRYHIEITASDLANNASTHAEDIAWKVDEINTASQLLSIIEPQRKKDKK